MSAQKLSVLVVGATRGLGASLASKYASKKYNVYGTARGRSVDDSSPDINWITNVDIASDTAGEVIAKSIKIKKLDLVVVTAGFLATESFEKPDFEKEVMMYKICAIGPIFVIKDLFQGGFLQSGSKVIFVTSEAGSIALRHESQGGGMYGHHASKTAMNMNGKLLSFDLKEHGVAVGMIHPGFMRTEMTKGAGMEKFYDEAGAVKPDEAAEYISAWVDTFDISKTGSFWAPRGPCDIGDIEKTMGPKEALPTPLELPW